MTKAFGLAAGFSLRNHTAHWEGLQPRALAVAALLMSTAAAAQSIPDMKPGDTCAKLRAIYGQESSLNGPAHIWKQEIVETRVLVKPNGPCVAGSVFYYIQPSHTLRTRDGIVLGEDTTASAVLKLKGRINSTSFYFIHGEGKAYAKLEIPPSPTFPFKTTYGWQLNSTITEKLKAPPTLTDFTTEPVTFYSIDLPDPRETQ
jgi:hypothetical protein